MILKYFSSSLSRQSSETKPRTNLVLVSREPLLYLQFNKPNKQNVSEINLCKKFNFSQCQKTVDTLIDVRMRNETSKHHFWCVKISKIKYITLLSDASVPVCFRAQQRVKYN